MIWLGFLRAVNVGKRRYPMAECRAALATGGFTDIATHIQTGNVRVSTSLRSRAKVEAALEKVFADDRGFEVPTICLKPEELRDIVEAADALAAEHGPPGHGQYVELFRDPPSVETIALVEAQSRPGQRFVVRGRAMHLLLDEGFHNLKPPNAATKRSMGDSTNRNLTVLRTLVDTWC